MIALAYILGYLTIGVIFAKISLMTFLVGQVADPWDNDDVMGIATMVFVWPLWWIGLIVLVLARGVKRFLVWDIKTWQAARRAKRMEEELDDRVEGKA